MSFRARDEDNTDYPASLPVFSVDTRQQAEDLLTLVGKRTRGPEPRTMFWHRGTPEHPAGRAFSGEYEDMDLVGEELEQHCRELGWDLSGTLWRLTDKHLRRDLSDRSQTYKFLIIPQGGPYPGGIPAGRYSPAGVVYLMRQLAGNENAVRFLADMLEE